MTKIRTVLTPRHGNILAITGKAEINRISLPAEPPAQRLDEILRGIDAQVKGSAGK